MDRTDLAPTVRWRGLERPGGAGAARGTAARWHAGAAGGLWSQGKLITNTYNEFVDVIGNKTSHLSPSEIIPGADFKVLLNWLKVRYDYILMEGSSLNDNSDSRELVAFADKVIPVFSADAVLNEEDRESLHFLRSLNGKLGCGILNRVIVEESSSIAAVF
jgi:hypothetical protein